MQNDSLKQMSDLRQQVEDNLSKDKFLAPVVILFSFDGVEIMEIDTYDETEETKTIDISKVVLAVKQKPIFKICLISETWIFKNNEEEEFELGIKPKQEAYMIAEITKEDSQVFLRKFSRQFPDTEFEEISFGEEIIIDNQIEFEHLKQIQDSFITTN